MASETSSPTALMLLFLNLFLYIIVMVIAAWAVNHGIERSYQTASVLSLPAHLFPIYFPMGNMATGFFVIFSLLVGVLGITTSLTGIHNVMQWTKAHMYAASVSSLVTWALTLLAMGLASKEIDLGWTDSNLRTLETVMIILSGTQLLCASAIHFAAKDAAPPRSIRSLWIVNNQDVVVFSRRFPVVERRWRASCKIVNESTTGEDNLNYAVCSLLPTDSEFAEAFAERKRREGSVRGFGIRVAESVEGSDSWVDDPITRHIISLHISKDEEEDNHLLWPLILHIKGLYCILVLPLVEPKHLIAYGRLCKRSDCGTAVVADPNVSSLLLDLPSITGALMVAHVVGDIITGDTAEPEVVVSASPSVGGLLDSLTGSIGISGISARSKPVVTPTAGSTPSSAAIAGSVASDVPKIGSRLLDKDALHTFLSSSMPFGTPLDLSYSNISAIKINGFSSLDMPPTDIKQPAWKPYLYRGKQRMLFTVYETIHAAMYDRDEIPDSISITGQVNCRAELEGLPDVSFPLTGLNDARAEVLSFHPCVQVSEQGVDKQAVMFSPPTGNFVLMRYQAFCSLGPPVKGFYQLSMVSENEGAFLFKLRLMEGYKAPLAMEFCTVTMPFPRRRVISFNGTPSIGTVSTTEHLVEWKIITSGRGFSGKSIEATFPGTVRFAPLQTERSPSSVSILGTTVDDHVDTETENSDNVVNIEEVLVEKMSKDLPPADLEEPFCWQAYDYAKVSFKIMGASLSGMSIDPKSVNIYPAVKAPVEFSTQVSSGDYILWNTLGACPSAAMAKIDRESRTRLQPNWRIQCCALEPEDKGVLKADGVQYAETIPFGDIEPKDINPILTKIPIEVTEVPDEAEPTVSKDRKQVLPEHLTVMIEIESPASEDREHMSEDLVEMTAEVDYFWRTEKRCA
ncbi:hypothetical protein Nepgr_031119 [Nepenthes gracilis]|uniref:MHD domain-containing protein n=1 Tax=Nepenthes gracilis TaxID=150966 RepID=A0AAD3THH9_NEPGR|nr:hypothetical protein Nepgr_031119 [Nepenthes gracilis]